MSIEPDKSQASLQQTLRVIAVERRHIRDKIEAAMKENLPEKVQRYRDDLSTLYEHETYIQEETWSPHYRLNAMGKTS